MTPRTLARSREGLGIGARRDAPDALLALALALAACTGTIDPRGENAPEQPARGGAGDLPPVIDETNDVPLVVTPRLARLSHAQWTNTVRDLLRLPATPGLAAGFTADATSKFDNAANELSVGETLRIDYERAAETLATAVARDPAALARILPSGLPDDPDARVEAFVRGFVTRAYRRPLAAEDVAAHVALFKRGPSLIDNPDAFAAGAELLLRLVLQSPHFLYRTELTGGGGGAPVALDAYDLASRLSFTLAGTMPDDALFAAAAAGTLTDAAELRRHAERLFALPAGREIVERFFDQEFHVGRYANLDKDPARFPEWNDRVPAAMQRELRAFVGDLFASGGGVADVFTSRKAFVDATLAPIYGLAGSFSETPTAIELPAAQRAGILTRAGFLAELAERTEPKTIMRGVFVNIDLLCRPIPPPIVDPASAPPGTGVTNRERVESRTGPGTCGAACHATVINPPGYALEHYDALGRYRTQDQGQPVNARATFDLDGTAVGIDGGVELSAALARSGELHACMTKNLLSYFMGLSALSDSEAEGAAIGRFLADYAAPFGKLSLAQGASLRDLGLAMATSRAFTSRLP